MVDAEVIPFPRTGKTTVPELEPGMRFWVEDPAKGAPSFEFLECWAHPEKRHHLIAEVRTGGVLGRIEVRRAAKVWIRS